MTSSAVHLKREPALDGLRGFAALSVVVAHLVVGWSLIPWPPMGGVGVLVFFVLSGYLIASISLRMDSGLDGYRTFLRRRVVRLGPAIAAVAVIVPLGLWWDSMPAADALAQSFRTITQANGLATASGWTVHPTLNPTWSLTTEWIFYVIFPLCAVAATRRAASLKSLGLASLGVGVVLYVIALPVDHTRFYYLPIANVGVLCIGAALAYAHAHGWGGPDIVATGPAPYFAVALLVIFVLLPGYQGELGLQDLGVPRDNRGRCGPDSSDQDESPRDPTPRIPGSPKRGTTGLQPVPVARPGRVPCLETLGSTWHGVGCPGRGSGNRDSNHSQLRPL